MFEAIVLSRRSFREYDTIVSLFTKEQGKIEALARSTKKIISKNAPHLEPFSFVHIGIVKGSEIAHITSVQSIEFFSAIRNDLKKSLRVLFGISWLDRMVAPEQKDVVLFETLLSWLRYVESEAYQEVLLDAFLMKSMSILGFEPQLHECVFCSEPISPEQEIYFSFLGGGVLCIKDMKQKQDPEAILLSSSTWLGLRYILLFGWKEILAFQTEENYTQLHTFVLQYMTFYTEKNVEDWK